MAMTGGTSYLLVDKNSVDGDNRVRLYLYVKEKSQDISKLTTTLQLGMYVNSTYAIGSWTDGHGSYIGTSTSGENCKSFNGSISYGSGTRWLVENKEVTIKHASDGTASAKIYWKWGVWAYTTYIVGYQNPSGSQTVSITPIKTKCTEPTNFTATPNNFETDVTLQWSGAKSGVGNSIAKYQIRYAISTNNKTWDSWIDLKTVDKSNSTYTQNVSSLVARGCYIKFAIRALCSDSNYYSPWAFSDILQRKAYTKCTAPTTFTVSPDDFETTVTLKWSGASGGTSNAISGYNIQYATSSGGLWGSWTALKTVATTKTSFEVKVDISTKVQRGQNVKFRIRTQGSAGSSYYSDYKTSSTITRNPYSACTAPTIFNVKSTADSMGKLHDDLFSQQVNFSWGGAKDGDSQPINSYSIRYRTSTDASTWGTWKDLKTSIANTVSSLTMNVGVTMGHYVQFAIQSVSKNTSYSSDWKYSSVLRRNTKPNNISTINVNLPALEFSYGDAITIDWVRPDDIDNNIYKYNISIYNITKDANTPIKTTSVTKNSYTFYTSSIGKEVVDNNEQIQIKVQAVDIFGVTSSVWTSSPIITRYDITGISIEIDGKWRSCQLYYLPISATVQTERITDWDYGFLDNTTGQEIEPRYEIDDDWVHMRTDYLQSTGITVLQDSTFKRNNVECTFFYYDNKRNFITKSETYLLNKGSVDTYLQKNRYICPDESYALVRIVLHGSLEDIDDGHFMKNYVAIEQAVSTTGDWIEYEARVEQNGQWTELYDGT